MDSILDTIKVMLGIEPGYLSFDTSIIAFINSALMSLSQLGIKPEGFKIIDKDNTWTELVGDETSNLESVKHYIYLKVRLAFDSPTSSFVIDSITDLATD